MEKIREMALISLVIGKLKKSLGLSQRVVAEFLIDIARKSESSDAMMKACKERKLPAPIDLITSIYNVVVAHDKVGIPDSSVVLPKQQLQIESTEQPEVGRIYRGRVSSINAQGAFVKLEGFHGKQVGFLHIKDMKNDPGSKLTPSDIVGQGQHIFVRVLQPTSGIISLSIRGVDQATGLGIEDSTSTAGFGVLNSGPRLSSAERFEMEQLMRTGQMTKDDYDQLAGESKISYYSGTEEYFEIVLNKTVPPFLQKYKDRRRKISPQRVESNPEGSLARSAKEAIRLSRERQENRRQQSYQQSTVGLLDDETPSIIPTGPLNELPEWKQQSFGSFGPQSTPKKLPIIDFKERIHEKILNNDCFILVGETGCGKTTQIPQMIYEWGITDKIIAVTQPRRVAAISVARRVAEEMQTYVGGRVGYQVRFDERTSPETRVKFMTDGMLLKECLNDNGLSKYGIIMLDEAHERTVHTDVLFGLIKQLLAEQREAGDKDGIKVIVTSATLQSDKFSKFFFDCPVLSIPGRTFPVETVFAAAPFDNYLVASVRTVLALHKTEEKPGDILLFLTGQDDIDTACESIFQQGKALEAQYGKLIVLPIYSSLPTEQQTMIFLPTPPGERKVVVATNIAETSITIDGIRYVIDPGLVKEMRYDPRTGMDTLEVVPISKAAANQRKGRAGRTAEGKCIRLYTEEAFNNEMRETSVPEIQRANMAMVALDMKVIGIDDLIEFDFMDKPPAHIIIDALDQLYQIAALDEEGELTTLGRSMSMFSLNPQMAKMLIMSATTFGCSEEVLKIVAVLSVQGIWYRPRAKQAQADAMKARLNREEGDHITLLHVFNEWIRSGYSEQWCRDNFVHYRALKKAEDVRKQLVGQMERFGLPIVSCGRDSEPVIKSIVSGYFAKAARRDIDTQYRTLVDDHPVYMFPGSALYGREPEYVIFHELVNTTREYMRTTIAIEPRWLVELAPSFFRKAGASELTRRKYHERLKPLATQSKNVGERDWRITNQRVIRL